MYTNVIPAILEGDIMQSLATNTEIPSTSVIMVVFHRNTVSPVLSLLEQLATDWSAMPHNAFIAKTHAPTIIISAKT